MAIPEYQQRVIIEHKNRSTELSALLAFLICETYRELPYEERARLSLQRQIMTSLVEILEMRINAFNAG